MGPCLQSARAKWSITRGISQVTFMALPGLLGVPFEVESLAERSLLNQQRKNFPQNEVELEMIITGGRYDA